MTQTPMNKSGRILPRKPMSCFECGKLLSIYNNNNKCFSHVEREKEEIEEALRGYIPVHLNKGTGRIRRRKLKKEDNEEKISV